MFKILINKPVKKEECSDISFIDVKLLYDAAYAEKEKARVNLRQFKKLMSKAAKMDEAYRKQLLSYNSFSVRRTAP